MRIAVCPSDRFAVGWYRLGLPIATLQAQECGIEFEFLPGLPVNIDTETEKPVSVFDDFQPDVLILQRPMAAWQVTIMQDCQQRGIKVVVELDDNYHALPRHSPHWWASHPNHDPEVNRDHLKRACQRADLVTTTTRALAKAYAPHGRVAVLPNYVSESWCDIVPLQKLGNVVGWTGRLDLHAKDLPVTHGGVGMAIDEANASLARMDDPFYGFKVIGRSEGVKDALGLSHEPKLVEWTAMDRYPHEIAKLDVGIAPLADTAFNRAKSWLKPLEMAACGVPVVMSPTDEYTKLSTHGIGVLAHGWWTDWKKQVGWLLNDPTAREELAERGRQAVREDFTIEGNAWRWVEAWASTLTTARR